MNGTDMNLDITYQDTQYLAELYRQLGSLQHDLANFDIIATNEKLHLALFVGLCGVLIGIFVMFGLVALFECTRFDYIGPIIGMVIYVIILIAIWYIASDWSLVCKENSLMRNIEATEMAIEAIKMKYGWI